MRSPRSFVFSSSSSSLSCRLPHSAGNTTPIPKGRRYSGGGAPGSAAAGLAVRRGCCPASRAAAWLAAGAGCTGVWCKPPPADGVPAGAAVKQPLPAPRVRRVVFRPSSIAGPKAGRMGRSRTCDSPFSGVLYQTELPVVQAGSRTRQPLSELASTALPSPGARSVRHAGNPKSLKLRTPGTGRAGLCPNPGL